MNDPNSAKCLPSGAKAGTEADEDDLAVDDLAFFSCIRPERDGTVHGVVNVTVVAQAGMGV